MPDNTNTPDQDAVIAAARALFRDPAEADRWLTTHNPDLAATPIKCLDIAAGREQVMVTIGWIEHGVFD